MSMLKIFAIAILVAAALGSTMYTKARYGEYLPNVREAAPSTKLADTWRNFVGSMPHYSGMTTNPR